MKKHYKIKNGVYLFPFTAEAVLLYHVMIHNGIKIFGFLDNDAGLNGETYLNCPITLPEPNEVPVIICGHRHYQQAYEFKNSILIEEIIEMSDITGVLSKISQDEFARLAPRQVLRMKRIDYDIRQVLLPENIFLKEALVINSINLLLTSCCTLKCRDCSDLMQYYRHPEDVPFKQVIQDLTNVFNVVDFVRNITLVGGEPLLYQKLPSILDFISIHRKRIGVIWVTTNGTLIPSLPLLESIKASGALLRISDYGTLSRKKNEIVMLCKKNGVRYEVIDFVGYKWRQGKVPVYPPVESMEANQYKFSTCQSRVICNSIFKGKFYFCEFIAHMEDLMGIPYSSKNSLELEGITALAIRNYFSNRQYAPACAYCTGDNIHDMPFVEPAVQTKAVLPYQTFAQTYRS